MTNTKINLISLGCAKNLIDSEHMLAKAKSDGLEIVQYPEKSDVVIINTCGFIESAKQEAIEQILDIVRLKESGIIKGIVVTGCLTQRYKDTFFDELPEVDAILGTGSYENIVEAVEYAYNGKRFSKFDDINEAESEIDRIVTTGKHTAYLKIAEGCDFKCSFCVIPSLRGKYRSRKMEDIILEAEKLAKNGTREIIVIAQDTTRYGIDLYGERMLVTLLKKLAKLFTWVRLHYLYPDQITDELIDCIATEDNIVKYLDIPMQHASSKVLKDMKRNGDSKFLTDLILKLRKKIPNAIFRTSIIVGFPDETEEDFKILCEFLKENKLERAGVFKYSREEGSTSYDYPNQIDEDTKNRRQMVLEEIQSRVLDEYNEKMLGKTIKILIDGKEDGKFFGRTYGDSLDVDGLVWIEDNVLVGEFYDVCITGYTGADFSAKLKGDS